MEVGGGRFGLGGGSSLCFGKYKTASGHLLDGLVAWGVLQYPWYEFFRGVQCKMARRQQLRHSCAHGDVRRGCRRGHSSTVLSIAVSNHPNSQGLVLRF